MTDSNTRIAVIGSGMAGLTCAVRLKEAGCTNVTVLDKGRRPGGRLAAKRVELADGRTIRFDHGGQFATVRDDRFQQLLEQSSARPWRDERWIGTPTMRSIAEAMASDLAVSQNTEVGRAERTDGGWLLWDKSSESLCSKGPFSAVVVTAPAPQAGILFPQAELHLADVSYDPCWAVMLAFEARWDAVPDVHEMRDTDLAWITRENAKPGREQSPERLVVHMNGTWSQQHLELTPGDVSSRVLALLERQFGPAPSQPLHNAAHRWRYAKVARPLGAPILTLDDGLILAGDWCLGGRVEAAYLSGLAAAESLLRAGE